MKPEFSLVIPTVNNISGLSQLLSSLRSLTGIERTEILLVENPASGQIDDLARKFSDLNIHCLNSDPGVNRARNAGLRAALGELIFFFDDDCWLSDPELLVKHHKAHAQNQWALAVGGYYRNRSHSPLDQAYDEIQREWLVQNRLNSSGECQMLLGGHFSMKRLSHLPEFDNSIVYGGAETEFFFRLHQAGHRFFLIDDFVEHQPHLTLSTLAKKAALQGRTHRQLIKKGHFIPSKWISCSQSRPQGYKALYYWFFNYRSLDRWKLQAPSLNGPWRAELKELHQKVCFYLENRELF